MTFSTPMYKALVPVISLLASTAMLLVGHGLQLTLLPLRADWMQWGPTTIGLTATGYFAGFVFGCLSIPKIIARVGHIRAFAVLAACAAAALLLLSSLTSFGAWVGLRFATGWALAGLYMVIESWINESAPNHHRGSVLSVYTTLVLLAMAAAQLLVPLAPPHDDLLFKLGAVCICLSLVPVGLTSRISPRPVAAARFGIRELLRAAQASAVVALFGGMVTGTFWALGPLYARLAGFEPHTIGLFMMSVILGGAVAQYPLGRWSDRVDRRIVLLAVTALGAAVCLASLAVPIRSQPLLLALGVLFGAVSFPIYALCVAHANDNVADHELVETAGGILMVNGVGSMVGPVIAAPAMTAYGPRALLACAAAFLVVAFVWTASRLRVTRDRRHFDRFLPLTRTSQSALDLLSQADRENRSEPAPGMHRPSPEPTPPNGARFPHER